MTRLSDLPEDLVEAKILPRVSLTALRSTCKKWNVLSKSKIFVKALVETRQPFIGFIVTDSRVFSLRFNFQEFRKNRFGELIGPSINQVSILDKVDISNIFYWDGLLLCAIGDNSRVLIWNPYLGQRKWIQPRDDHYYSYKFALGYDKNRNHKILRILENCYCISGLVYEIYSFKSDSWKPLAFTPPPDLHLSLHQRSLVSLKGNTYFLVQDEKILKGEGGVDKRKTTAYLLCFDYTTESFGPRLPLPFHPYEDENMALSCVREEQLAVLYQHGPKSAIMEIWITTNIEPNAVSWSSFFKVDLRLLDGSLDKVTFGYFDVGSFFIDEEKKVAVVFRVDGYIPTSSGHYDATCEYNGAYIIGENEYFKTVAIKNEGWKHGDLGYISCFPLVCSTSYVPSLLQLHFKQPGKRKEREY